MRRKGDEVMRRRRKAEGKRKNDRTKEREGEGGRRGDYDSRLVRRKLSMA